MATDYGVCVHIGTETTQRLYGNRAISLQLLCSLLSLRMEIRAEAARRWCGDPAATVPFLSVLPLCGARESIQKSHSRLLPPHGGRAERGIRAGYGLRRPIAGQM